MSKALPNPPTLIESSAMNFIVFEAPNDANLPLYIEEMKKHNCKHLVRACDATYGAQPLVDAGITVHEYTFPDGSAPPDKIISEWIKLLQQLQKQAGSGPKPTVALHCIAGLGRAPVLVAIAMIENGMEALEVIKEIRAKRAGALNMPQVKFLQSYKKRGGCAIQ